jgi:hypothetical protein
MMVATHSKMFSPFGPAVQLQGGSTLGKQGKSKEEEKELEKSEKRLKRLLRDVCKLLDDSKRHVQQQSHLCGQTNLLLAFAAILKQGEREKTKRKHKRPEKLPPSLRNRHEKTRQQRFLLIEFRGVSVLCSFASLGCLLSTRCPTRW